MPITSSAFSVLRAVLLGSAFAATAHGDTTMTVTRCTADLDNNGIYQPVLQVALNGETHVYRMGSDGLTRSILFNNQAAIDWAVALLAADATDVIYGLCAVEGGTAADPKPVEADTGDGGEDTGDGGEDTGDGGEECPPPCGCYAQFDPFLQLDPTFIGPIDRFATI